MSKVKMYKYKPYSKEQVPGVYSESCIRHRNFAPRVKWSESNMKKILEKKELK